MGPAAAPFGDASWSLVGDLGFEPRLADPESAGLPLPQSPVCARALDPAQENSLGGDLLGGGQILFGRESGTHHLTIWPCPTLEACASIV